MKRNSFSDQFSMSLEDHLKKIDLQYWWKYYFVIKELIEIAPKKILEIGAGNYIVKNVVYPLTEEYLVMDINPRLTPDILSDLREFQPALKEKFDCVICLDVLEHMPFEDLERNLRNIFSYLRKGGKALITIPDREKRIGILDLFSHQKPLIVTLPRWLRSPKGYFRQLIKREKIKKDPHHCWEIRMDGINKDDVEEVMKKVGFKIKKFMKLLYVDFWVLEKNKNSLLKRSCTSYGYEKFDAEIIFGPQT